MAGIAFTVDRIDESVQGAERMNLEMKVMGGNAVTIAAGDPPPPPRNPKIKRREFIDRRPDIAALNAELASRNIHVGGIIGGGATGGMTFNLLDEQGVVIPSVVMRVDINEKIDPVQTDNPAIIKPIKKITAQLPGGGEMFFSATIVPRAQSIQADQPEAREQLRVDLLEHSLPVMNAGGTLPHLRDVKMGQFMTLPGIETPDGRPMPVLTDVGSSTNVIGKLDIMGGIEQFLSSPDMKLDVQGISNAMGRKADAAEMARLIAAQQKLDATCREDLQRAGVRIEDVPPMQDAGAQLSPVDEKKRGVV